MQGKNIGFESQQIQVLIAGKSQHFFLSCCLDDDVKAQIFLPISLLAAPRFSYLGFLFFFSFFPSSHFIFFFSLQPTERLVNTKLSNSDRGQRSQEGRREKERPGQPLLTAFSCFHCAFLPFSENHLKQMRIAGKANSLLGSCCLPWNNCRPKGPFGVLALGTARLGLCSAL